MQDKRTGAGTRALSSYEAKVQYELRVVESMQAAKESSVDIFGKRTDAAHMGGQDVTTTFLRKVTQSTEPKLPSAMVTIYTGALEYLRFAGHRYTLYITRKPKAKRMT